MIKKVEGIIISELAYGETSKIINIFTKEHGIIGVIAKGSKSLKSKLRTVSEKYTYGYFHIYYKEDKLSTLIEVDVINYYSKIKSDLLLFGYLAYICELSSQVFKDNNDSKIYNLLISVINKIDYGLNPVVLTNILEIKLLDYIGVSLNLDECVMCGNKTNIITINGDSGGFVCAHCRTNEMIYDDKTIKMLRMYYYVEIDSITSLDISNNVVNNINDFLNLYYERYTGLYLHTKKFLKNIVDLSWLFIDNQL